MSMHAVYVLDAAPHYADGDHVASNTGWDQFCTFVEAHPSDFPECFHLTDNPVDEAVPGSLDRLAAELARVQEAAAGEPDVAGVAKSLADALASRPAWTCGFYVSDGEPGEDEFNPAETHAYE